MFFGLSPASPARELIRIRACWEAEYVQNPSRARSSLTSDNSMDVFENYP
jgi:hypothetical protein